MRDKSEAELRVEKAEAELEAAKAALKEDRKIQDVVDKLQTMAESFVKEVVTLIGESSNPAEVYKRIDKAFAKVVDMEEALKVQYPKVYDAIAAARQN